MVQKSLVGFAASFLVLVMVGITCATPLSLNYSVTDLGGSLYDYEFNLVLDNNDGIGVSGQGWKWFIFGDQESALSPLTNFVGVPNDLSIGPWTGYSESFGFHNGPTLDPVSNYWVPTFIGETLSWSGTSTANLSQGELLFSTISVTLNGGIAANFEVANLIEPFPEPATMLLLGTGLVGVAGAARRQKKNQA